MSLDTTNLSQFFQKDALIDLRNNLVYTKTPIEEFFGAKTFLIGRRVEVKTHYHPTVRDNNGKKLYLGTTIITWFEHHINPCDFKEGLEIEDTNIEVLTASKHKEDLRDKCFNSLAFSRKENELLEICYYSIWASDKDIYPNWVKHLKNKYTNVALID